MKKYTMSIYGFEFFGIILTTRENLENAKFNVKNELSMEEILYGAFRRHNRRHTTTE
jgi:hypothetical protein